MKKLFVGSVQATKRVEEGVIAFRTLPISVYGVSEERAHTMALAGIKSIALPEEGWRYEVRLKALTDQELMDMYLNIQKDINAKGVV